MTPEQTTQLMHLLTNKRKQSGLSVAEVAQQASIDRGMVWRFEQGMIATPKADSLKAIGDVLDPAIDIFTIVGWISAGELPSFGPYLRAKYPQLPPEAVNDIETHFAKVAREYDIEIDASDVQTKHEERLE